MKNTHGGVLILVKLQAEAEGGQNKSLKKITVPNPKPSSDIRTFFKGTECQREQVTSETECNVPSNAIKSDLIVID